MFATYLQTVDKVKITAAGVNHFTWMLSLEDRQTKLIFTPYSKNAGHSCPRSLNPSPVVFSTPLVVPYPR
jgi:alpha-galactosidase/6-phospho-beta-glucosidase family protein